MIVIRIHALFTQKLDKPEKLSVSFDNRFAWRIAHSPVQVLTNDYSTLYTPPIFCVKSIQAETIIAVVESVYWGWLKSNLSEIAAVRQFLDIIVKACTGEWAILQANRAEIEKLPDPSTI